MRRVCSRRGATTGRGVLSQRQAECPHDVGQQQVAEAVGGGSLAFGLTDTDDALGRDEEGHARCDRLSGPATEARSGTLFIPNTLALIQGSPHPKEAEKLLDYLLSGRVERRLAEGPSAQIPLQPGVEASQRVKTPAQVKAMDVDWAAAAAKWEDAAAFLKSEFAAAD